jgi:serine/threonine-protein kinase HipA
MNQKLVKRCLVCYKEIKDGQTDYHPRCAKNLFGKTNAPLLPYTRDNIESLALQILERSTSVTGVQPKLSLDINRGGKNEPDKLTIVGLWGNYILKPQSPIYAAMPELEDLTMKLAEVSGIATVAHGLIRMNDGELAYITRRVDRGEHGEKISMLDMCQLTNRLTEHKYRGAYIQLAQTIKRYSATPMLDVQRFWKIVLFSWITGNSDMHCKNFSLIERFGVGYQLSPAYDLLAVWLTGIKDNDELAMPLVGFGTDDDQTIAGFNRASFVEAMYQSGIEEKISSRIIDKMCASTQKWDAIIDSSFLSDELQSAYKKLVRSRIERLLKL